MSQFRNLLNKVLNVLAGVSFLAMVALTCWQVFTRYILGSPSSWSEELVSYLFAWMSLFGATLVVGERGHMNIPILIEKLNMGARKALAIFAEVIACLFAIVILIYGGVQITTLAMGQMTSSLGVPVGVFYVVMPISGVLMVIYTALNIADIMQGNVSPDSVSEADQALENVEKEGM
uniref:TRAP transporter small permease n=1 Tax=Agathobacter sp. TaxID=2021311 RepID=UPI00405720B1